MTIRIQDVEVGEIGYGLLGFRLPNHPSDDDSIQVLKAALELGANYWNAAEYYGTADDNTLTLLRKYFERYPEDADKVVLNVKGCFDSKRVPDGSPEGVKRSIEHCLKCLDGRVKIHQFAPSRKDRNVEIEVTVQAIDEYVKAGKIGGVGLSEVSAETLRRAAKVAEITSVEVAVSLWDTDILTNGLVEACAELDIPILAYSPLGKGLLAGQFKSATDLSKDDFRQMMPRYQGDNFEANMQMVAAIDKLAREKGCTPAQIAINWVLALSNRPGMPRVIPIPGTTKIKRLEENFRILDLTTQDLQEIDMIIKEHPVRGEKYHAAGMATMDI